MAVLRYCYLLFVCLEMQFLPATIKTYANANNVEHHLSISCVENCLGMVNFQKRIVYEPLCTNCSREMMNVSWKMNWSGLSEYRSNEYTFIYEKLLPDTSYHISLEISVQRHEDGATILRSNKIIHTTLLPKGGVCAITPKEGYSLITSFIIKCPKYVYISGGWSYNVFYKLYLVGIDGKNRSLLYSDMIPRITLVYLPAGNSETDYGINVQVDVIDGYGTTAMIIPQLSVKVYPMSMYFGDGMGSYYNLLNSTNSDGSGTLENMISEGNKTAAILILSTASNMINSDTSQTSEKVMQRLRARGQVVSPLKKATTYTVQDVKDITGVLNSATQVTAELAEETKSKAVDEYSRLASSLDALVKMGMADEVKAAASSLVVGVTNILFASSPDPSATDKDQMRNSTNRVFEVVETLLGITSGVQEVGANKTCIRTDQVTLIVQKVLPQQLLFTDLEVQRLADGKYIKGSFIFPQSTSFFDRLSYSSSISLQRGCAFYTRTKKKILFQGRSDARIKALKFPTFTPCEILNRCIMILMDRNPFSWHDTADNITSPVATLTIKDENMKTIKLQELEEPIKIVLFHPGNKSGNRICELTEIQKMLDDPHVKLKDCQEIVPEDQNSLLNMTIGFSKHASEDQWTMDLHKSKFPNLRFETTENATTVINVSPHKLNISLLFLIDDTKPTFTDILTQGTRIMPYSNWNSSGIMPALVEYNTSSGVRMYNLGIMLDINDTHTVNSVLALIDPMEKCSNEMTCHLEVNVTVRVIMFTSKCLYWNKEMEIWSTDGCKVSSESSLDEVQCLCDHLTSFANSVLVLPNFVDPIADAKLFLTFFENPVVVATVVFVWLIYFTILQWVLRADRNDKSKIGVIVSSNNEPSNHYLYVVSVTTGWWRGAGTTAQVYLYLMGDKGISSIHCLTDNEQYCFQSGSQDCYLITTESSLGDLTGVTIWHDNTGNSPRWYLSQITVKDLQMSRTWTFLYNDWLAIDRGAMLSTVATLPAVSEEQFKQKHMHHFLLKSSQDLRDGHLWVSIFCKPARSTFTRAQRLTCGLSLLLTNMLTNIMFHGIPTDDPEAQLGVSGITISLTAIVIGIESSLIMFPINLIILQLFLRVAPKPKDDIRSRRKGTLHQSKRSLLDVHGQRSEMVDMKTAKEEQTLDEKNQQSSNAAKSPAQPKKLPWWFIYIAWFLVLATALVSSYFVMLYGLKYGYVKSVNWLVSFLTGFSQSAVVQQPLKVICVALVITLILKKTVVAEEYGYDEELAEGEEYLHTIQSLKRKKHPALIPPSPRMMEKIRHRLHLEWFMNMILKDMVLYVFFLTILLFMIHGHRNVTQAYMTTEAIRNSFFHATSDNELKLYQINTVETVYEYLENTVIPHMTVMSADDGENDNDTASFLSQFHLVGPYRLRQVRVVTGSCHDEIEQLVHLISVPYCVQKYWIGNEDTDAYDGSWKNRLQGEDVNKVTPWIYQSAFKLETIPFPAKHAIYSGGGYVIDMPKDVDSQLAHLQGIKDSDWIDDRTRAIFIEFTLFNPNVRLFSVVMMILEFTNIGAIFPFGQVFTANMYHYDDSFEIFVAVCEVAFLLFTVLFTFIEYTRFRKIGKKEYFEDPWNYVEVIQIALSYIVIGLFFERMVSVKSVIKDYQESRGNKFVSFYTAISWDFFLGNFMAFLVGLVILKAFKLLKFNKRMYMLADTVVLAKGSLGSFILMTGIFFMAFGHFALICFGKDLVGYVDLGASLVTLVNFALGVSDFAGVDEANRILGPLFFFSFVFLAQWCFMTFFMGIIDLAISDAKSKLEVRKNKYELLEYILRKLKENILHK